MFTESGIVKQNSGHNGFMAHCQSVTVVLEDRGHVLHI